MERSLASRTPTFPDGLAPTGRKIAGPAYDLVELQASGPEAQGGLVHTAIVFHPEFRDHPALAESIEVVAGFLESPMVVGLVELVAHPPQSGVFVYPTGTAWSVRETTRIVDDIGKPGGIRAGLELMYAAGQILVEAAEVGEAEGVYAHGSISPGRVMLKRDGQVLVIGHGLPQVEILQFLEDERKVPREDSFRYCPPERLKGEPENLSSDLFALCLVAFELMTGKPVYDGLVKDIRQQAARGEGSRRLYRFREVLPDPVKELLSHALHPEPGARFESGTAFLEAVRGVLSSRAAAGPSLMDLMDTVTSQLLRSGKDVERGETAALAPEDLKRLVGEIGAGAEGRSANKVWNPDAVAKGIRRKPRRTRTAADEPVMEPKRAGASERGRVAPAKSGGSLVSELPPKATKAPPNVPAPAVPSRGAAQGGTKGAPNPRRSREEERDATEDRTKNLLEQIRAAKSDDRVAPDTPGPKSAGALDVLAQILQSSSERAARPSPADPAQSGSRGRRRDDASIAAPALPARAEVVDDEDADDEQTAPLVHASDEGPPAEHRSLDASSHDPDEDEDTLRPVPALKRRPADDGPVSLGPISLADPPPSFSSTRTPDPLPTGSRREGKVFKVRRGRDVPATRIRLPNASTLAEAISWLIIRAVPLRADLQGRLTGWYRVEQKGRVLSGTTPMSEVDAQEELVLVFLENTIVEADVEVRNGASSTRFVAQVGTAVPAATLVDHLCAWLQLEPGTWTLEVDGERLDPHQILQDRVSKGTGWKLVLQRAG